MGLIAAQLIAEPRPRRMAGSSHARRPGGGSLQAVSVGFVQKLKLRIAAHTNCKGRAVA